MELVRALFQMLDLLAAHEGAHEGNIEAVKVLLEADVNAKDKEGYTPLHWAAALGHVEAIKVLVEAGADVNPKDEYGSTPLHWAVRGGMSRPSRCW